MQLNGDNSSMVSDEMFYILRPKFVQAFQIVEDKTTWPDWIADNEDVFNFLSKYINTSLNPPFKSAVGSWLVKQSDTNKPSIIENALFYELYMPFTNSNSDDDDLLTEEEVEALGLTDDDVEWIEIEYDEDE